MDRLIPSAREADYPWYFRLARTAHTLLRGYRGQYYLYHLLARWGKLDRAGRFDYFDDHIFIPLKVPETLSVNDFSLFEGLREIQYAFRLNALFDHFYFVDCGAYFGQVSMRLSRLCPGLAGVLAIDPSAENCAYCEANIGRLDTPHAIVNAAVSDFSGSADLKYPDGTDAPDSAYIVPSESGSIPVLRLDDVFSRLGVDYPRQNIALKLDVEGEELAAIHGAQDLLREAAGLCLFLELHPGVLRRKGHTAEDLLRSVAQVREMEWYVADEPWIKLSPDTPVWEQIGRERICDVIGTSVRGPAPPGKTQ